MSEETLRNIIAECEKGKERIRKSKFQMELIATDIFFSLSKDLAERDLERCKEKK